MRGGDGRLFYRRAAATGNTLSPTVDRRVRRTSRDVDEAERSRCLASVFVTQVHVRWQLAPDHVAICTPKQRIYIGDPLSSFPATFALPVQYVSQNSVDGAKYNKQLRTMDQEV